MSKRWQNKSQLTREGEIKPVDSNLKTASCSDTRQKETQQEKLGHFVLWFVGL